MTKLSDSQAVSLFRKKLKAAYRKRKIGNADKHIDRLLKSVYPTQHQDYVMVTINKRDFPCDAPLYPIVNKLLKLGFCCNGWDAALMIKDTCFISVMAPQPKRANSATRITARNARKQVYDQLSKHFPGIDIVIHDPNWPKRPIVKHPVLPNTLQLDQFHHLDIHLVFKPSMIDTLARSLKVKPIGATKQLVLPGTGAAGISDELEWQVHKAMNPPDIDNNCE